MPRDYKVYLDDIIQATEKIKEFIRGIDRTAFASDIKTFDAVVRNLEIIGEAIKQIPDSVKAASPDIEWKKIAGLRDILIHEYFGIDMEIVWDVVTNKLPILDSQIQNILKQESS